jgi:putative membrane protein
MDSAGPGDEADARSRRGSSAMTEALAMMAGWDMTLAGWLWMFIWIGALLVMVWLIVRRPEDRPGAEDAMAILRSRFARGEISQDEFERARSALIADQPAVIR